jgi:hypothetical protein
VLAAVDWDPRQRRRQKGNQVRALEASAEQGPRLTASFGAASASVAAKVEQGLRGARGTPVAARDSGGDTGRRWRRGMPERRRRTRGGEEAAVGV